MYMSEFNQIVNENFDLSDNYTRRFIASLNESGQEQLIAALSSALYEKIVAKVDEIDFGTIPQSRGDITKVQGFANTEQCVDIIRKLVIQYNQKTDIVDSVITAISNIKERKNIFTKAFNVKADMPIMIYNLMVLAIERSVSLIIATCIQFVKDPQSSTVKTALDKVAYEKTMDDMLFKQLVAFNGLCKTGTMDKTLNSSMTKNPVHEEVDIVGAILGREDDGEIGDGESTSDMNPFNPENDVEPFGNNESEPVSSDDGKFDVYNPANKPEINPQTPPVSDDEDDDNGCPEGECPEDDDNGCPEGECPEDFDNEEKPEPPIMVAKAVRMWIDPQAADDNVEPENIPTVTTDTDDDPGVTDEPITETDGPESEVKTDENEGGEPTDPKDVSPEQRANIQEGIAADILKSAGSAIKKSDIVDTIKAFGDKNRKIFAAAGIVAGVIALPFAVVKIIIPFIRSAVYYFYYTNMKVSDYLEIQAELIEANANEVENSNDSDMTDEKRAKVVEKQRKWAERLRKWSNIFAIDHKQAQNKAANEAKKDSKEKKTVSKDEDGDDSIF